MKSTFALRRKNGFLGSTIWRISLPPPSPPAWPAFPRRQSPVYPGIQRVEHRLEFLRELDGVVYYNDSKATTPEETIAGLRALSVPVVLIAGGYDKKLPFTELAKVAAERCRVVILIGATAGKIPGGLERGGGGGPVTFRDPPGGLFGGSGGNRQEQSRAREAVLLSTGAPVMICSAIFEERGRRFKELVFGIQPRKK